MPRFAAIEMVNLLRKLCMKVSPQPLLPQAFWFRLSIPCPAGRRHAANHGQAPARLALDLPFATDGMLDGRDPGPKSALVGIHAGWPSAFEAEGELIGLSAGDQSEGLYGGSFWVDTRDTRDVSRATRFCHRFDATLARGSQDQPGCDGPPAADQPRRGRRADRQSQPDPGDRSNAPSPAGDWSCFCRPRASMGSIPTIIAALVSVIKSPTPAQPLELLGVGREFPIGENPSLWSTLELVDPT